MIGHRLGFDDISLSDLRVRKSEKWARYPPDVLSVAVAEMDFHPAPAIIQRIESAIRCGDFGYHDPMDDSLAQAFVAYAAENFDWQPDIDGVCPTTDVMVGVAEVIRRLTAPGDSVIVTPPVYPPFFTTISEVDRVVAEVPLVVREGGYSLDLRGLDAAFQAGARALLLCNPHNPTGTVFAPDELSAIVELADAHGAFIVSDEIHAPLTYSDAAHQPLVSLNGAASARAISVMSASKGWNLAGLKCAVILTEPGPMRQVVSAIPMDARYRTGHLGALASAAAWAHGGSWMADLLVVLDRNRRRLDRLITERLPEVSYRVPAATYFGWLDFRQLSLGPDPAEFLLRRGKVALESGVAFGAQGRGFARFNFATSEEILLEAFDRICSAVEASKP